MKLFLSVLLCAVVGVFVGKYSARGEIDKAFTRGAKVGATGVCWHLTFVGNGKCDELAERIQ